MSEKNSGLRKRAEEIFSRDNAMTQEEFKEISHEETVQMFHELHVHQIELEMQNDELRRSQEELDISRARYFDLYDLAPVGYVTINEKGTILEANLTAATMLGESRSALSNNQVFSRFILNGDRDLYYLQQKKLFNTQLPGFDDSNEKQSFELRMEKADKTVFWAHFDSSIVEGEDGVTLCRLTISDITEFKQAEIKIQNLLEEKEIILREVHHRIKNNMGTIKGLLFLQADAAEDPVVSSALHDAELRISSMMVLYDKLYCSNDFGNLSVKEYFYSLIDEIISNFPNEDIVKIEKQIEDFTLTVNILSFLGIILNELLTNIMKYAFTKGKKGLITVSVSTVNNHVIFLVGDDGSGIAESIDFENAKGFGLQMVSMLTEQIGGTIRIERGSGTKFIIEFDI